MAKGKRPVGATHAGNRPKTAPATSRWQSEKVGYKPSILCRKTGLLDR